MTKVCSASVCVSTNNKTFEAILFVGGLALLTVATIYTVKQITS